MWGLETAEAQITAVSVFGVAAVIVVGVMLYFTK